MVRGMVISSMPIGEYDRRLEILTDSMGRISAFARGARKPSSPLVSISRVFAFGEFDLYEGRNSYSVNA
ncbi:MAG: recombination protein O N-terminal domain-containing protein, partial [Lachnospiraceae bacterium]|nr:recombination protein O N-terminal domain-containing protein [Lachnospiraceae bacterium]